jgi:hypothetical protein
VSSIVGMTEDRRLELSLYQNNSILPAVYVKTRMGRQSSYSPNFVTFSAEI